MTAQAAQSTEVLDLRGPVIEQSQAAPAVAPWPNPSGESDAQRTLDALRRRRRLVVAALLALVGLVMADFLVGRVVHDQQQRHRAAALQTPSPHPKAGDAIALMQIPAIGFNQVVVEGTDSSELRGGPGLVPTGSEPGKRGTSVILGHRYRYGAPFTSLNKLKRGQEVVMVINKIITRYTVSKVSRVPFDGKPLSSPKVNQVLLVTSAGGLWPDKALVVALKPDTAPTKGKAPNHPVRLADGASLAGLLFSLVLIAGVIAAVVVAAKRLRDRYRLGTVLTVLVPLAALALIVVVMSMDLALSAIY